MFKHKVTAQSGGNEYFVPKTLMRDFPFLFRFELELKEIADNGITSYHEEWQECKSDVIVCHLSNDSCRHDTICSMTLSGIHHAVPGNYRLAATLPTVFIRHVKTRVRGSHKDFFEICHGMLILRDGPVDTSNELE